MGAVSVVLVAEEPLFRLGMRVACERRGLAVAADVADRAALVRSSAVLAQPRVVVIQSRALDPDPVPAVAGLAAGHRVLVLEDGAVDRPQMLRAGASGFLAPPVEAGALCSAVQVAAAGGLVVGPGDLAERVAPEPRRAQRILTTREVDVLRLIAGGGSTKTAARELHLSAATIKTHLRNASAKLHTRSRAATTAKATALGLLG